MVQSGKIGTSLKIELIILVNDPSKMLQSFYSWSFSYVYTNVDINVDIRLLRK